jgi:hypothetical protein
LGTFYFYLFGEPEFNNLEYYSKLITNLEYYSKLLHGEILGKKVKKFFYEKVF